MKPKCFLINPWIYDFAAVNLWTRPLGLLKVAEFMSQFDINISFLDCMDVFQYRKYGTGKYPREIVEKPSILRSIPRYFKRYGISLDSFIERFKPHLPCDFIFVTSIMSYWYPGVQKVIELVKSLSPQTPVILGGIYATLHHDHSSKTSGADIVFKGHIYEEIVTQLKQLGISISINPPTPPLIKDGNGGLSNRKSSMKPYYRLHMYQHYPFAPILTSQGCPFMCTYCASKFLFEGFMQRNPDDVVNEIKNLHALVVRDFAFYDDALLVNADLHIKVILKEIIKSGMNIRFHCPNGLHARFIDDELAWLMKKSGFATLRLSLETINDRRLAETGGKVSVNNFKTAVTLLKKHGFTKKEIGVYLMYGLPGQDLREIKEGVDFLKSLGVKIHLTEFSPIPGTQCWKKLIEDKIITDNIDPLLTNNTVFSYLFSGYDQNELERLKIDVKQYNSEQILSFT